jgi:hypothetical protein
MKRHPVVREFESARLGHGHRNKRLLAVATAIAKRPGVGSPKAMSAEELEGYYRLVNNNKVRFEDLLQAHVEATVNRLRGLTRFVVAHDTTDLRFTDEVRREGLGPMDNGGQGFYAHFALAVGSERQALGILRVETWVRPEKQENATKPSRRERYLDPDKESLRWGRSVDSVEKGLPAGVTAIHVMDREADDYDFFASMLANKQHFVVRASFDRRLIRDNPSAPKLKAFARSLDTFCERDVKLSSRRKTGRTAKAVKLYPTRQSRMTTLAFAAKSIEIQRPDKAHTKLPESLTLNIVHVTEPQPPEGCEPVEWFLLTSEPVDTEEQALQVVDDYRKRWLIEEYFKALKTGCAYEKRQNETLHALLNVLGIYIPVAWSLLNLRTLSRSELGDAPAADVFTDAQVRILRHKSKGKLPKHPTIREAVFAMAKHFGGLLRSNGEPGWQVLGRGYESLLEAEVGWELAVEALGITDR